MSHCDFAHMAHRLVIIEKIKPADTVARMLGMSYDSLYARLAQRVPFRPSEARCLIRCLADIRLADVLLDGTPFIPADRPAELTGHRDVMELTHEAIFKTVEVLREVKLGLQDQRLDHRDSARIIRHTMEAGSMMVSLRLLLEKNMHEHI